MDYATAIFSSALSIVFFFLIVAGVLKVFQIATTLGEIKTLLQQRQQQEFAPPSASPYGTGRVSTGPSGYSPAASAPQAVVTRSTPAYGDPATTGSEVGLLDPRNLEKNLASMSGEAMLRALDLEMRAEAGPAAPSSAVIEARAETHATPDRE